MTNIVIFGATSLAKLAHFYATEELKLNVIGFVVDDEYWVTPSYIDLPVFKWSQFKNQYKSNEIKLFVAIGYRDMRARSCAYEKVISAGYEMINIISKSSHVSAAAVIGVNNFIMSGVVIEPFVQIESNNIFWSNSTVCHDTKIGSHNFLASNVTIGGNVSIGNNSFFGFSTTVTQGLTIEDEVLVGAGSLIIDNLKALYLYFGSPSKPIKEINPNIGIKVN